VIWILLAVLAVLAGGLVAYRRARQQELPGGPATPLLERTLRDVRPNDVVQHGGRDYLVEGVVSYDEDGHTWRGARLLDGGDERWLLVGLERGSAMTVRLLALADVELTGYPPETLEVGGTGFKLAGRGTATVTLAGDLTGVPVPPGEGGGGSVRCRWWRYSAAGDRTLVVEQWGETYRALAGETVRPDDVDLLGAS
jgi:hypothetical protein